MQQVQQCNKCQNPLILLGSFVAKMLHSMQQERVYSPTGDYIMKATPEQIQIEREYQTDLWVLRKDFYNPEESEQFWSALIEAVDVIHEKYKSDYVDQMLLVCVDDIEHRFKKSINSPFIAKEPLKEVYRRLTKER